MGPRHNGRRELIIRTGTLTRGTALALAITVSCARPSEFRAPVATFSDASAVVIRSTQTFLQALNKTERDHYIDDQVASQAPIQLNRLEEVQVFGPEAIAARTAALDALADYTELLLQLATTGAPDAVKGRAKDLGTALSNLSTSVSSLTGADNERFRKSATTVFPVIGDILKAIVEQNVESALKKAIAAGAQPVNDLIAAIEVDAEIAYERKRSALSKRRADAAVAYNAQVARGAAATTLRRLGDAIADAEDQWEAFQRARPATGLEAMRNANTALEKFAKNRRPRPADVAEFTAAMHLFAATAARLAEDVAALRALQRSAP